MAGFKDPEIARQAGRKSSRKGSPNKATADLREFVSEALEATKGKILKDLESMEARDRVNAWLKLAEFVLPKLTRTQSEISGIDGGPIQTQIVFTDAAQDENAPFLLPTPAPAPATITPATIPQAAPLPQPDMVFVAVGHKSETVVRKQVADVDAEEKDVHWQ